MNKIKIIFPPLFLSLLFSLGNHSELIWKSIESEHFFAHFHNGTDRTAMEVIKIAEFVYTPVTDMYDYRPKKKTHIIIKDTDDFSNRGFIHFRTARPIMEKIDIESFLQKEMNRFINLENRELIGGGLRINQFNKLYFGIGIMHEMEKYNNPKEQNFIKSTNYINYKANIFQAVELQNVIYYQFKIEEPGDYRILWDGSMAVHASAKISFHINTHYHFDKNGENYFEFSNGLGCQL